MLTSEDDEAVALANDEEADLIDIPLNIAEHGDGYRLDRYLAMRFARLSRSRIHQMIAQGRVICRESGEALTKKSLRVRRGQKLLVRRPAPSESQEPPTFTVLHCDEGLLVVDKPGHLAVHPSARYHRHTLTAAVLAHFGPGHGWEMAHRLDRETSGVMLFGQRESTAIALKQAFFSREIEKEYLAIVWGHLPAPQIIDIPLGMAQGSKVHIKIGPLPLAQGGLHATTLVAPVRHGRYRNEAITLVQIWLLTGRTHQIRVHCEAIGYPLVGDKLYGGDERHFIAVIEERRSAAAVAAELGLDRQALHAVRIGLRHPSQHERMTFSAPWPRELSAIMDFDVADLLPGFPDSGRAVQAAPLGPCRAKP